MGGPLPPHAPDRRLDARRQSQQSDTDLRAALPEGYWGRATRSDYGDAYVAAFPQRTHRCCGKAEGETCHVERWFGTLRQRVGRLVRKTLSFSKQAENHLDALHFLIASYNLAIKQSTLG